MPVLDVILIVWVNLLDSHCLCKIYPRLTILLTTFVNSRTHAAVRIAKGHFSSSAFHNETAMVISSVYVNNSDVNDIVYGASSY